MQIHRALADAGPPGDLVDPDPPVAPPQQQILRRIEDPVRALPLRFGH
jgi:hypothetical protein